MFQRTSYGERLSTKDGIGSRMHICKCGDIPFDIEAPAPQCATVELHTEDPEAEEYQEKQRHDVSHDGKATADDHDDCS